MDTIHSQLVDLSVLSLNTINKSEAHKITAFYIRSSSAMASFGVGYSRLCPSDFTSISRTS